MLQYRYKEYFIKCRGDESNMVLYIIRHGNPDYEHDTLTPLGEKEAEALGEPNEKGSAGSYLYVAARTRDCHSRTDVPKNRSDRKHRKLDDGAKRIYVQSRFFKAGGAGCGIFVFSPKRRGEHAGFLSGGRTRIPDSGAYRLIGRFLRAAWLPAQGRTLPHNTAE